MQAVTAVIDVHTSQVETAGVAPDLGSLLDHHRAALPLSGQLPGGSETCRAGTQDRDPRHGFHFM